MLSRLPARFGPQVWYEESGQKLAERETALQVARKALAEGKILAVKGLGGFHLVQDAQNPQTVENYACASAAAVSPLP